MVRVDGFEDVKYGEEQASHSPGAGRHTRCQPSALEYHDTQARQFLVSQTPNDHLHLVNAFIFELSKVDRPDTRVRMVAGLPNAMTTWPSASPRDF